MSISDNDVDLLQPGDVIYSTERRKMGNTTILATHINSTTIRDVTCDAHGCVSSVMCAHGYSGRVRDISRYRLMTSFKLCYPVLQHGTYEDKLTYDSAKREARVERDKARNARDKAKWAERRKAHKALLKCQDQPPAKVDTQP